MAVSHCDGARSRLSHILGIVHPHFLPWPFFRSLAIPPTGTSRLTFWNAAFWTRHLWHFQVIVQSRLYRLGVPELPRYWCVGSRDDEWVTGSCARRGRSMKWQFENELLNLSIQQMEFWEDNGCEQWKSRGCRASVNNDIISCWMSHLGFFRCQR